MTETLHLRDLQTVIDETGMSRARVLELRAMREPAPKASFRLADDWASANALREDVNERLAKRMLNRLGPKTGHRRHDTGTGPIALISGGYTMETLRSGHGPCQVCDHMGTLVLVGGRWLCANDARRARRRATLRRMVA